MQPAKSGISLVMYHTDYTKELGLDSGERIVPWRYLIPILAALGALAWFGARIWLHPNPGSHSATPDHGELAGHA